MTKKVAKHLKEDIHEFKEGIKDDKSLIKSMKSKMRTRAKSK